MAPTRLRPWRVLVAAVLAGGFMLGYALVLALQAPDVPMTCTKLLELAEQAGEDTHAGDREICEQRYEQLRRERGVFGWARLAWCVNGATTIPDAGGC